MRLDDDKGTQPAENIAPLVRNDLLARLSDPAGFAALLDAVSARVTTGVLTNLGIEVAVNNKDIADVATTFLYYNGW